MVNFCTKIFLICVCCLVFILPVNATLTEISFPYFQSVGDTTSISSNIAYANESELGTRLYLSNSAPPTISYVNIWNNVNFTDQETLYWDMRILSLTNDELEAQETITEVRVKIDTTTIYSTRSTSGYTRHSYNTSALTGVHELYIEIWGWDDYVGSGGEIYVDNVMLGSYPPPSGDGVSISGTVFNASSNETITYASISLLQGDTYYNDTSAADGTYSIQDLSSGIPIYVNVTKIGYTHEDFDVTALQNGDYTMDLYLLPTVSGVHGLVVDYPWHQAIYNSTVWLWNATYNTSTTTNQAGYYLITGVNNSEYTMNASASGYATSDDVNTTVADNVSVQSFVLTTQYNLTVNAIDSVTNAPITSFTVTIENSAITTTNGSAVFLLDYGLYLVSVVSSDYYQSSAYAFLDEDQTLTISMLPTESPYYAKHYVKFTVQSIWGTKYKNVDTTVYNGSSTTALYNGITGSDGSVVFELDENVKYRFTFINLSQGISESRTLYPVDDHYYIIVSTVFGGWNTYTVPISQGINFTISKSIIDSTHAYINFSYTDNLAETTSLDVMLNQTGEDYFNQTNIDSFSGVGNNTHSFLISNYAGQAYLIHLQATHTTYGTIDSTYSISFSDDIGGKFPGIPPSVWLYGAIFMLLFVGGIWTASNVERGALVTVVLFFVLYGLGCFATLPAGIRTATLAGGVLGFIIAVLMNLNKSNRDEGFQ